MSCEAGKYPRLSPWEQAELLERAAAGEGLPQLAKAFGLHRATVCRLFARYKTQAYYVVKKKQQSLRHLAG